MQAGRCDMNANWASSKTVEKAFPMLFTQARRDSKEALCAERRLSQGQFGGGNAHCKQSPAIAMVLKGLTCSHMIVIISCEAGKRETRRKHIPADTESTSPCLHLVLFCMFYVKMFASSIGLLLILHRILYFSTLGFSFPYCSVRLRFFLLTAVFIEYLI